jgi:hypothetical protein
MITRIALTLANLSLAEKLHPYSVACRHSFEEEAIQKFFATIAERFCPSCRKQSSGIYPNLILGMVQN